MIENERFNQILHWKQGHDYEVVSLQAVMADSLKGNTIHHACGIPIRKRDSDGEVVTQTNQGSCEKLLYWRWLIVDEFGIGGADFMADLDIKFRDFVVDVNPEKYGCRRHYVFSVA